MTPLFISCATHRQSPQISTRYDARLLQCLSALSTLSPVSQREEGKMKNPLDSLWGTVIAGFVLTIILYYIVKTVIGG